jgi:opacity protein-like surface antigen
MRRGLAVCVAAVLVAVAAIAADSPAAMFVGTVSDSECGLDHTRMKAQHHLPDDFACTLDCCRKYKQEYVLADHATGDVFQIDDQKKASRFANRLVRVLGTLDEDSGTIHVVRIEPVR